MSNTVVQTWPVVSTRVVEVEVPGIQGPQGPKGDLTAEAKKVRDEITKIKADVEASEANASASAEKAQEYAEDAEQAHQDTVTEKNNALSAIQTEGQNQIDLIEAEGEEQIEAVESAGNTAVTGVQIEAGKQIERIQKEGGLQVDRVEAAGDAVVAEVEDTKDSAVAAVEQEGTTQTGLVTAEGQKQVNAVTTEGNKQIANVKAEGEKQVAAATAQAEAAEAAKDAAVTAQTAAETAQGKAETAQTEAESAASASEQSKEGAVAAQTAAETAQGKAETAQSNAEAAQSAAETAKGQAQTSAQEAASSASAAATSATNAQKAYEDTLDAKADAIAAIQQETTTQISAIQAEGTTQKGVVTAEGTKQVGLVEAAGTTQTANAKAYADAAEDARDAAIAAKDQAEEIASQMGDPLGKEEAASTYATKTELTNGLATKSDTGHKHVKADVTDLAVATETEAGLLPSLSGVSGQVLRGNGQWAFAPVQQNLSSADNKERPLLMRYTAGTTGSDSNAVLYSDKATINSTTGAITAPSFIGDLTGTAAKATADASGNDIPTTYATKAEVASDLSNKSDVGHGHAITDVSGLRAALDSKQPTGDYATNTALTEGLAGKSDVGHTHTSENITDWDDATVSFWSTERSATGGISASGSMGWSTIWSGTVNGDAVTTGFMVNVDSGDPMLTIQAKRGQQYGQIVLTKSDIRLQTGSGKELSVNSLMTTIGSLGQTYAPLSHTHTTAQVTGLDTALAGKAAVYHTHTIADLPKASQAEAEAGSDDTKVMTPAVTKAAILELAPAPDLTPYATTEALNALQSVVTALQTTVTGMQSTVNTINTSYMPKSGGTFTGAVTVQGTVSGTGFQVVASNV